MCLTVTAQTSLIGSEECPPEDGERMQDFWKIAGLSLLLLFGIFSMAIRLK
jgi:hypothetical protein